MNAPDLSRPPSGLALRRALAHGLGRAVLWSRAYPRAHVRLRAEACLLDTPFSRQFSGPRDLWASQLLETLPPRWRRRVRARLLRALAGPRYQRHVAHRVRLLGLLAERGDRQALRTLERAVARDLDGEWAGAETLCRVGGAPALERLLVRVGARVSVGDGYLVRGWVEQVAERHGSGAATAALARAAQRGRGGARAAVLLAKQADPPPAAADEPEPPPQPFEAWWAQRRTEPGFFKAWRWARRASDEDVRQAAETLLAATRSEDLKPLGAALLARGWPGPRAPLVARWTHPSAEVRWWTVALLEEIADPLAAHAARRRLAVDPGDIEALRVLCPNADAGDRPFFEAGLPRAERASADQRHLLAKVLHRLAGRSVLPPDLARMLRLWIYEHSPCGTCRADEVTHLVAHGEAPAWLLEEAALDAEHGVRAALQAPPPMPAAAT